MSTPTTKPAAWLRQVQAKVHKSHTDNSPFTETAIVAAAERNLQSYLKRVERKIVRKANKGHKILVTISGYSEYRIMFFYKDKHATTQFIRVPHRRNKLYSTYANHNQALYNKTYIEAACRELGLELNTTDYIELPFTQ